jgi:hypothetical protein
MLGERFYNQHARGQESDLKGCFMSMQVNYLSQWHHPTETERKDIQKKINRVVALGFLNEGRRR